MGEGARWIARALLVHALDRIAQAEGGGAGQRQQHVRPRLMPSASTAVSTTARSGPTATLAGEARRALTVAAVCQARAERAFEIAVAYAAQRRQFGQPIGKFQGIGFPLADMATDVRLGDLLLMNTAWKVDQGASTASEDCAMAKVWCSEMLGRVADQAIQTCGGMGVMTELPLERIYRDARVERIWEGTSEIQRHIISRRLLTDQGA